MSKVKAEDYQHIGVITFQELLSFSESEEGKSGKKRNLIDIFVDYAFTKFGLDMYVIKSEMNEAIFIKKDEVAMLYQIYIKKTYLEDDKDLTEDVKKIIGLK